MPCFRVLFRVNGSRVEEEEEGTEPALASIQQGVVQAKIKPEEHVRWLVGDLVSRLGQFACDIFGSSGSI